MVELWAKIRQRGKKPSRASDGKWVNFDYFLKAAFSMNLCMPVLPKHRNPKSFLDKPPVSPICPRVPRLHPALSRPPRCRQTRGSEPAGSFWPCVSLSIFIHFGEPRHFGNLGLSLRQESGWFWAQKGPQGSHEIPCPALQRHSGEEHQGKFLCGWRGGDWANAVI